MRFTGHYSLPSGCMNVPDTDDDMKLLQYDLSHTLLYQFSHKKDDEGQTHGKHRYLQLLLEE